MTNDQRAAVPPETSHLAVCPVCKLSSKGETVLSSPDRLVGGPGVFRVVRCRRCTLAITEPRLSLEALKSYYPRSYPSFQAHALDRGASPPRHAGQALNRLRLWYTVVRGPYRAIAQLPPGRLLDVGCGGGVLGEVFVRRGWEVHGVDPSADACSGASKRGLVVHCGEIDDAPWARSSFDAVIFNHSLEHLDDPIRALRQARQFMRDGGLLVVSVPNFGCWQRRVFRGRWFQLDVPRHLQHFDRTTLTTLVREAGFAVRATRTQSMLAGLSGSLQYAVFGGLVLPRPVNVIAGYASAPLLATLDAAGQGDCLSVLAAR